MVRGDVEAAVRGVHCHKEIIFVIEQVIGARGLRVVYVRDGGVGVRVGVDKLYNVSTMITFGGNPAQVVIVKPDGEFSGLVSRDHLAERVVEVSLTSATNNESSIIVGDEIEVAVRNDSVATVHADVDPILSHLDADDVTVDIVGVGPVVDAIVALNALKLSIRVVRVHRDDGRSSKRRRFCRNPIFRVVSVFESESLVSVDPKYNSVRSSVGIEVFGVAERLGGVLQNGAPERFISNAKIFDHLLGKKY